jgi:hypothetical protein
MYDILVVYWRLTISMPFMLVPWLMPSTLRDSDGCPWIVAMIASCGKLWWKQNRQGGQYEDYAM